MLGTHLLQNGKISSFHFIETLLTDLFLHQSTEPRVYGMNVYSFDMIITRDHVKNHNFDCYEFLRFRTKNHNTSETLNSGLYFNEFMNKKLRANAIPKCKFQRVKAM